MGLLPAATTRSAAGTITAASFNSDFAAIKAWADAYVVLTDTAKTVTAVVTFSAAPIFSVAPSFTAGLAVTGALATFGAGVTVTGIVTATTFSGSGASLTSLPAAQLSGTLPALNGSALTALNATALTTGTVSAALLPASYSALAVTTLTAAALTKTVGGDGATINLAHGTGGYFFVMTTTNDLLSTTAPVGAGNYYLTLRVGTTNYLIKAQAVT